MKKANELAIFIIEKIGFNSKSTIEDQKHHYLNDKGWFIRKI